VVSDDPNSLPPRKERGAPGDRRKGGRLFPATELILRLSVKKLKQCFAAKLLSPFEFIDEMLEGDYSIENQLEVAQ